MKPSIKMFWKKINLMRLMEVDEGRRRSKRKEGTLKIEDHDICIIRECLLVSEVKY